MSINGIEYRWAFSRNYLDFPILKWKYENSSKCDSKYPLKIYNSGRSNVKFISWILFISDTFHLFDSHNVELFSTILPVIPLSMTISKQIPRSDRTHVVVSSPARGLQLREYKQYISSNHKFKGQCGFPRFHYREGKSRC